MKKKFRITEEQAQKILNLSEQWPQPCEELATQLGGVTSANQQCCTKCATGSVAANDDCYQYCNYGCCSDDTTTTGDDPCKNPDTATEECYICRETGAGCLTLSQAGMSVQQALNANPPFTLYSDVNQCNQFEDCSDDEPCPPPAGGCPAGTMWNQVTCHCDPVHTNDDPCETFNIQNQNNSAWGMAICKACDAGTPNAYQAQYCECCPSDDKPKCCCKSKIKKNADQVSTLNPCVSPPVGIPSGQECSDLGLGYIEVPCNMGPGTPPTVGTLTQKVARPTTGRNKKQLKEQDLCSGPWPNMTPDMQEWVCTTCSTPNQSYQLGTMVSFCECCEGFTGFNDDPVPGCTTPGSVNYNANANTDDGSCVEFIPFAGCSQGNVGENLQAWVDHYYGNPQANIGFGGSIDAFSDQCEMSPDGGDLWAGQIEMNVPGAQAHYIAACECVQSVEGVGTGDWTGGGNTDAVPYTQSQISASGKPDGGPMAPYKDDKSKKRKSKKRKIRDKKLQEELNRIKKLLK
tara:strand:+ start:728 stop:2278 length:1551 start_codon:yes stop_codon:yes gene_type:complete